MARFFLDYEDSFLEAVQKFLVADSRDLSHDERLPDPCDDHVDQSSVKELHDDEHEGHRDLALR